MPVVAAMPCDLVFAVVPPSLVFPIGGNCWLCGNLGLVALCATMLAAERRGGKARACDEEDDDVDDGDAGDAGEPGSDGKDAVVGVEGREGK